MFKKVLRAFGVGGPSVDTVLSDPNCVPGGTLRGEVRITGGDHAVGIDYIALSLVTRVERDEHGGSTVEFLRTVVAGRSNLEAGVTQTIPFEIVVPWEAPINQIGRQHLPGMALGLRTELAVAKAVDKGDLDPVFIQPLPAQAAVLEGFAELGFRFRTADLEAGRIHGVHQELPFFQEIEFVPREHGRITEVELTFIADAGGMTVILEADRRGGMFAPSGDAFGRFHVTHDEALSIDWARRIDEWLTEVGSRRAQFAPQHGHHGGGHHRGPGVGGMVGGLAAGLVGGMVLGEVLDEAGDMFFGDEG